VKRLLSAALAATVLVGSAAVVSTKSVRPVAAPPRTTVNAQPVTHAVTVGKKKKKKKKKKHHTTTPTIGTAIKVAGESSGEKYKVTLTGVVNPATESDGLSLLPAGDILVAVELTVQNVGSGTRNDDVLDDSTLIDSGGHTYAGLGSGLEYTVSQCQTFSGGEVTLPPGQSESGCVIFQIPSSAVPARFQYQPDAGFGSLAEWNLM
jgi:Domain of unknown function (DUF4352)